MKSGERKTERLLGSTDMCVELRCHEDTLLAYEKRGIVKPRRTESGRRIFNEQDLAAAAAYRARKRGS